MMETIDEILQITETMIEMETEIRITKEVEIMMVVGEGIEADQEVDEEDVDADVEDVAVEDVRQCNN